MIGLPTPLVLFCGLMILASVAFTWGLAKHEGHGRRADALGVVTVAALAVDAAFWSRNGAVAAGAGVVASAAVLGLALMASRSAS